MIQRIQSVYLAIAAIAGIGSKAFLFVANSEGNSALAGIAPWIAVVLGILALGNIFLFNNRKLQLGLSAIGSVLGLGLIGIGYYVIDGLAEGSSMGIAYYCWALVPMGFWLATKAIRRDIRLVKSMDSFR